MANEGITLDSDMVWYPNTGRSRENNNEERGQTNYSNSHGQDCDRGRGGRSNFPNVECYNCKIIRTLHKGLLCRDESGRK